MAWGLIGAFALTDCCFPLLAMGLSCLSGPGLGTYNKSVFCHFVESMETSNIILTKEQAQKLQYISLQTKQNTQDSIDIAINLYFEQIKQQHDPLARLKQSHLIASFHGDPNLSENSEAIVQALLDNQ